MKKILVLVIFAMSCVTVFAADEKSDIQKDAEKVFEYMDENGIEYEVYDKAEYVFYDNDEYVKIGDELILKQNFEKIPEVNSYLLIQYLSKEKSIVLLEDYLCGMSSHPDYVFTCIADVFEWTTVDGHRFRLKDVTTEQFPVVRYINKYGIQIYGNFPYPNLLYSWRGCAQLYRWVKIWVPGVGGLPGFYRKIRFYIDYEICTTFDHQWP